MINVFVSGVTGKMGKEIVVSLLKDKTFNLLGGSGTKENNKIGKDLGHLLGLDRIGVNLTSSIEEKKDIDLIIDFSHPNCSLPLIKFVSSSNIPLVIGTTGFTEHQLEIISICAKKIPILLASNTSPGISFIKRIIDLNSDHLNLFEDIEINEIHHKEKKDAPSGTAIDLSTKLTRAWNKKNKISIFSERKGNNPGEHKIILRGKGEIVEIKHTSLDRSIFAQGALEAARWIINKSPGLYSMEDIYSS